MNIYPDDLTPMLSDGSHPADLPSPDAPSLGADRKRCAIHDCRMARNLFGQYECPQCVAHPARNHILVTRASLPGDPDWFRAGTTVPESHIRNVRAGLHPMGSKLSDNPAARCGNCKHLVQTTGNASFYFKCALMRDRWTGGPGTDLRRKWHGCDQWKSEQDNSQEVSNV
jgi:hypothetical protein